MASQLEGTASAHPVRIDVRYQVEALLGRGGMATVYRVVDSTTRRHMALKQLSVPDDASRRKEVVALFEREFHTLAQLSHPRVIEVYDYGVDETGPYYTMELLDGGDLRERSPMPWQEACALLSGVCSSLALIHSRRLVHRDVSPANIRCTRDGQAKLIDFGALAPTGIASSIVGTPAFVAPEVMQRSALDGRTDLFSFGAALYFALTGRPPYPARNFSQLAELWTVTLPPPSSLVADVPEALDALVMSLLCLEPAMRPRTAFEVMQRLTAIAGIDRAEPLSVSQAYLSTPVMVGREQDIGVVRSLMTSAFAGRARGVLIAGESGVGRSRLLDACVVEAKMLGATTLLASANTARSEGFAVAQALAEQLLRMLPEPSLASARASGAFEVLLQDHAPATPDGESRPSLKALTDSSIPRLQLQTVLSKWILSVSETHPIAIAIDDVHEIDEPSAALLAVLVSQAQRHRLVVAATVETGAPQKAAAPMEVLANRSAKIDLQPLTPAQTEQLLGSLFGDVQNLGAVSDGVQRISAGNPRACMDLARHLVDKGVISYEGGGWTLPPRLDPRDLPSTAEEAIRDRIVALAPLSRQLAEAQALASDTFGREDYRAIHPDVDPARIDRALIELVSNQVLVAKSGVYSLAHRGWASALTAHLSKEDREERHRALAVLYDQKIPIEAVRHLLAGGLPEQGLARLAQLLAAVGDWGALSAGTGITSSELAATIENALDAAQALRRPPREVNELRRWLMSLSVAAEDAFYWRAAPHWLEQIKRDCGLADWRELGDADAGSRLQRAFAAAAQRYGATPESERVYRPDEAIKNLVHYVAITIAIGSRSVNCELLETLPDLLEPFASVSPVVELMRRNAIATCESRSRAQIDQARLHWIEVHDGLGKITSAEVQYIVVLRNAIAFAIGSLEARMGLTSAMRWADLLDTDHLQQVNAVYLRKIIALQVGDAEGAERYHRQAEVLALQARVRQMFTTTLPTELAAHALAGDLSGVKQVSARIQLLADAYPGWGSYAALADAQFQQLRGDLEAACKAFERCIAMSSPEVAEPRLVAWPPAIAGYLETLIGLERSEEARSCGEKALAVCQRLEIGVMSQEISRALALAEAKLGDYAKAVARLDAVIAEQRAIGITGLILGASYEARARIAIWAGDEAALTEYAKLTAKEYRHGRRSPLGARWERLMAEARRASKQALPRLADFGSSRLMTGHGASVIEMASDSVRDACTAEDRAQRTLKLLCDDRAALGGYLYLVGDSGLTLVASEGAPPPPDGLNEYLQEYFEREVSEDGDHTAAITGPEMQAALGARPSFKDAAGVDHHPVLMTSVAGGVARHAGVAVFVEGARAERPVGGAGLVAVLSTHLIQAGDTRGVAA